MPGTLGYIVEERRVKKRISKFFALSAAVMVSGPLHAHHSLAATYDIRAEGNVTGTVTKVAFTNPHGSVRLDVVGDDGAPIEWVMTTGSSNALRDLGLSSGSNTIKPGDVVTINYFPARNGRPLGFIRSITLPDQRVIEIRPD